MRPGREGSRKRLEAFGCHSSAVRPSFRTSALWRARRPSATWTRSASDRAPMDEQAALSRALAGRYRILRELGAGGMATVYLAEDLRHHRQVAIKVLRPELAATLGAERFVREIELTASLQHPHILPLFDSGS